MKIEDLDRLVAGDDLDNLDLPLSPDAKDTLTTALKIYQAGYKAGKESYNDNTRN